MTRPLTGFVLTGGKSSRMGRDKAMLPLPDGETLLEHAIALVASVVTEVRVLGARERYAGLAWAGEIIEDIYPERGPLAGIHAGLKGSSTELNLVLAVDMPAVTVDLLRYLVERAQASTALVVVPDVDGQQQPMCAVYRRDFYKLAEQSLELGRNKVSASFARQSTLVITEEELKNAGFQPDQFRNMNTEQEWQAFTDRAN